MRSPFALSEQFWKDFHREHWLKDRPALIKSPAGRALLSAPEILDGFRGFKRVQGASDHFGPLRVFRGHTPILQGITPWLPSDEDQTLDQYMERLARLCVPEEMFVTLSTLQYFAGFEFWNRLRDFLSGLYAVAGVPTGRASAEIFFGNYKKTSFGIHQDKASVFCFVISGKKKMRLWSHADLPASNPYPGIVDYQANLDRSILLEGEPGDIIFWPSSHWHIAEGDGNFNVSLSLALYHDYGQSVFNAALENLRYYLTFGAPEMPPSMLPSEPLLTHENIRRHSEQFLDFLISPQFATAAQGYWLDKLSSFSFVPRPKLGSAPDFQGSTRIQATSSHPILFKQAGNDVYISANGHMHVVSSSHLAQFLAIDRLNRGESLECSAFEGIPGSVELLQFLWKAEAITSAN